MMISVAPETVKTEWAETPIQATLGALGTFIFCIGLLYAQNKFLFRWSKGRLELFAQSELLLFIATYHFIFSIHSLYETLPSKFIFNIISLSLYYLGLGFFHYTYPRIGGRNYRLKEAKKQIQFLIPFAIPFLLFSLLHDIAHLGFSWDLVAFSSGSSDESSPLLSIAFTGSFLIILLIFMPAIVQFFWNCTEIPPSPLRERLETLCQKAHFHYRGMRIWTVMNHSLTAAIVGVIARYRYVMFTESLLKHVPEEQVEAILAHEIGHSYHKHLIIYPFIITGMIVVSALFSEIFFPFFSHYVALYEQIYPSSFWEYSAPFLALLPYALIMLLYFRYIFGYFSRLFERQADLYPLQLNLPAKNIIGALDTVAVASGGIHEEPSWHHFSINERIAFLEKAVQNSKVIKKHHRSTYLSLLVYACLLILSSFYALSPSYPNTGLTRAAKKQLEEVSQSLDLSLNYHLRKRLANKELESALKRKPEEKEIEAFIEGLEYFNDRENIALAYYIGSIRLMDGELSEFALAFIVQCWKNISLSELRLEFLSELIDTSRKIIDKSTINEEQEKDLLNSIRHALEQLVEEKP